ncbi:hypothetical protein [Thermodesulfobacterium commune]|uniref:hypothetical protein n=1 Tax=Thermodesulfobacterium commune TaxID=1741 RepID=UPI00068ED3A4|nr:hypothetical protein [Thermodesulfobacterium commune]
MTKEKKTKNDKKEIYKAKLLAILAKHVGKSKSIGMGALYEQVFGNTCKDKVNQARIIRALVTELRKEGIPICSDQDKEGGGYYLAAAGKELEEYCMKLRKRALKILHMEAILRNKTLPELLGQLVTLVKRIVSPYKISLQTFASIRIKQT